MRIEKGWVVISCKNVAKTWKFSLKSGKVFRSREKAILKMDRLNQRQPKGNLTVVSLKDFLILLTAQGTPTTSRQDLVDPIITPALKVPTDPPASPPAQDLLNEGFWRKVGPDGSGPIPPVVPL